MPIAFRCACGTPLKVKGALAGKKVKCPKCGMSLAVPEEGDSPDDEVVAVRDCPSCGEMLASDAVICISCGHDFRTGEKARPKKARKASREQSAEDMVENVLGYSGRVAKKKKRGKSGPSEENWRFLLIALFAAPVLAAIVAAIGCAVINAQPAESERRMKAFGVVGLIGLLAVVGPSGVFLRKMGELNREQFGGPFAGPYASKALGLATLMWLISLGILFGIIVAFAPP
jgi:DNA-directed RNA polymerase subunit M/transcription elongation factor TFIIS